MAQKTTLSSSASMKTSRALVVGLVITGFLVAHWSMAQSERHVSGKPGTPDSAIALRQLEFLVTHLHETKQTNTLRLFNDYSNALQAQRSAGDVGVTLRILMGLRDGRTNEAIDILERRLTSDVVTCIATYTELSPALREKFSLTILHHARDYCSKHQVKSNHSDVDEIVANAFKLLDEKRSK